MSKLTDDSPIPFGKHKGTLMKDVPASYLDWFAGVFDSNKATPDAMKVMAYIKKHRSAIDMELEDEE